MRRVLTRIGAIALLVGVLSVTAFAQEGSGPEHYYAVWAVTGGTAGGTTVPIDIRIKRYNTPQEVSQYAALLAKSGNDALLKALEKEDVGQFSPVGKVGIQLAVARKLQERGKTVVRVLMVRDMSFQELRNSGRSVDYPYTMLELTLGSDGKGTGTAIGAAKISFNKKKNTYEIESFQHGQSYNKLMDVQLMK
jgi:hypothetical protein